MYHFTRLLLALLLLLTMLFQAAAAEDAYPDLTEQINKALKNHKTVGAAIFVAKDGEILYRNYYGYASKQKKTLITENTYFKLASVTKMVTAVRALQLVEEGMLALDQDISEYLGYTVRNPYSKNTPITLRMLMTHTGSLNPHGGYSKDRNKLRDLISTDKIKQGNWYNETPGSVYRYSNFGAGIIGALIESVTQENIQDAVSEGLFEPMGITAAYSASLFPDPENVPNLYNTSGGVSVSWRTSVESKWDSSVNPEKHFKITVGSLWMKPEDLCRIGMMLCDNGTSEGMEILQEDTVKTMMSNQKGLGGITADTPYGLCLHRESTLLNGKILYGHQGLSGGVLCNVYFDPDTKLVFVLCSNGCHNQMEDRIAHVTRRVFDLVWSTFGEGT